MEPRSASPQSLIKRRKSHSLLLERSSSFPVLSVILIPWSMPRISPRASVRSLQVAVSHSSHIKEESIFPESVFVKEISPLSVRGRGG